MSHFTLQLRDFVPQTPSGSGNPYSRRANPKYVIHLYVQFWGLATPLDKQVEEVGKDSVKGVC